MNDQERQKVIELLRRIHLFVGLRDDQLQQVASMFHRASVVKGKVLIEQGAVGDRFYILMKGRVRVIRRRGREERELAELVPGDYFGEEALLHRQRRTATVVAAENSVVLWIDAQTFQRLTKLVPEVKARFEVVVESRRLTRRLRFDWIGKDEVIYLLARKHSAMLITSMAFPAFLMVGGLVIGGLYLITQVVLPLILGALVFLIGAGFAIWRYVDWGNDYYLMTNYRVVWVEQVVGLYESRVEAPLRTVLSISVSTDQIGRIWGYGDVVVRTYTGKIVLKNVPRPERMREFMEEHWQRVRRLLSQDEDAAMDRAIREKLGLPVEKVSTEPQWEQPPQAPPHPNLLTVLINRLFRTRYEEEGAIVYRKHWFILLRDTWLWMLGMLLSGGFILARLLGRITVFSVRGSLALGLVALLILFGGWFYRYLDWSNDIYRVTPDHIIDVTRTPFGREQLNSAPLGNILSMEHDRQGVLGLLLNFGQVRIRVGSTTFVFEDVSDPAGVQNEIFRRMEVQRRRKEQAEAEKERGRMARWLAVYHRNVEEYHRLHEEQRRATEGTEGGEE